MVATKTVTAFGYTPSGASNVLSASGTRAAGFFGSAVLPVSSSPPTISVIASGTSDITSAKFYGNDATDDRGAVFKYLGFDVGPLSGGLTGFYGSRTDLGTPASVTFCTDAPIVEMYMLAFATTAMFTVDGQRVTSTQFSEGSSGSPRLWKVDFGSRKPRTIRLIGNNLTFGGVYVGPTDTVWYATERDLPVMAVIGDSYTAGNGSSDLASTWCQLAASQLGFELVTDGVGGTGWLSSGSDAPVTRLNAKILALNPKPAVLVTALGYNDKSGDQTSIATSYDAAIAAIKSAAPSCKIVTVGPWTPLGADVGQATENLVTTRNTLKARAAANGVYFIDIQNWVNAANSSIYTGVDQVHPLGGTGNNIGHEYLGNRMVQAFYRGLVTSAFSV